MTVSRPAPSSEWHKEGAERGCKAGTRRCWKLVLRALCRLQASSGAAGGPPEAPAPTRDRGSHATRADRSRSRRDSAGPSRQGIRRSVGDRTSLRSEGSGCRRCAFDLRGAAETTSLVEALVGRPSGSPPLPSSPS
jgi:hypothetical protein